MIRNWKQAAVVPLASAALLISCDKRSDRGAMDDAKPKSTDARAIALNAARNGMLTKSATLRNAVPIQPGIFLMKFQVFSAAVRIHFQDARHAEHHRFGRVEFIRNRGRLDHGQRTGERLQCRNHDDLGVL